jgi:predicted regulator of Ras-like GTPase activity (Roadblock/LC7/MglB family)
MNHASSIDAILTRLAGQEGVTGAALVSRDGLCLRSVGKSDLSRETFSAMSATVMGAAEIALRELDGGPARSIVASTEHVMFVVVGASRELLVVVSASADTAVAPLVSSVERAAIELAKAISGG